MERANEQISKKAAIKVLTERAMQADTLDTMKALLDAALQIQEMQLEPQAAPQRCVPGAWVGAREGCRVCDQWWMDGTEPPICKGAPKPAEPKACDHSFDGKSKKCVWCGADWPKDQQPAEPQQDGLICTNCQHSLDWRWQFCANCAEPTPWMPKPPAEPPKPRRMMAAASCWDDGCPHVAGEHYEIRNVPGQPEVYYQDLCEYHKCQPVPNATAWVCVVDKDFTFNAGIATNVRVLPLPSREELGKIAWDALFPGYIPEYERYESIGASIYRALGVSE